MSLPFSQSCENNKDPILNVLKKTLASSSRVLEIGSGTGQHAVYFAEHLPHLHWQPSDQGEYLSDLKQRLDQFPADNIGSVLKLDVTGKWPHQKFDAVFTANTCHIMSWTQVKKMFQGLVNTLDSGGTLCIYGPFNKNGQYISQSNAAFDQMLKQRDPLSGIRNLEDMEAEGRKQGMKLVQVHQMPANNLLLEFHKFL
ncbi:class I SAM-dependent methyltransferase [Sansalvadorimonas sp. 2012CJ34-2]|uniref:Class I SAM-dependent methyltransferase n=1 Tax=Parendozoicomonas callyspongiae TaxID=2942213 RepID=A0ABT0PAK6_9GAMM|nr:DUF938 domain-containing protein [Sansalvadorimonas sp. 2012CJ34-2]MCL6268428.1 class I SAM-dependent methyltransferase [Sansalvadorimonas sp. 2012CJ34-2]